MDPYREAIDAWLVADHDARRKQRHTAHRIWIRLRKELGARVAESTVCAIIARASDCDVAADVPPSAKLPTDAVSRR